MALGCSAVIAAGIAASCGGSSAAVSGGAGGSGAGGAAVTSTVTSSHAVVSSSSGASDAGPDVPEVYPAKFPTPPQVTDFTGPVLASPRFVPVFFANEDPSYQPALIDFESRVGASAYWAAATSEYGVGPATATAPIVLTEDAPTTIDDSAIQTWLATELMSASPAWPAPDANTLYILHYPTGTTVTNTGPHGTASSCQSFGGYHNSIKFAGANVAYAVVPKCPSFDMIDGIDEVTAVTSHEMIEAVTDPYPNAAPAYLQTDDAYLYWDLALGGGELGDMCTQMPGVFVEFTELPYVVQRTWSNKAAKAGHDPCVPEVPGEVYFNSAPVLTDSFQFQNVVMKGVKIPVGSSKTIDVDLFSEGDTGGPWSVQAHDVGYFIGQPSTLELALDNSGGQNGDVLHLTISPTATSSYGFGIFLLTSTLGQTQTWWLGAVSTE